jgi:26S proteasome regulatory subunit T6|mmetsp:Transcript_93501/g.136586  ORF Transcript_93501/g.136586 Transcript_93501/m.136586 type:complete len:400 (-) Transcript_93501:114-1313(-)
MLLKEKNIDYEFLDFVMFLKKKTYVKHKRNKGYLKGLFYSKRILTLYIRNLMEEICFLQKEGSYVGEIIQNHGNKVLVKINQEEKYLVDVHNKIDKRKLISGMRVAIKNDTYQIFKVLIQKTNPLVSLMKIENIPLSKYEMIGGLDYQIEQLKEVIELPVKFPEIFESLGVMQPKGVLLHGPPGTGKTLLARAVAFHSGCTFIRVSGSELVQKYIGEGSRMVREIFLMAKENSPSIIFMDEVDSIGSNRNTTMNSGGDSEVQRTMLELLNQLDGFQANISIKILMATNRIDILDPALIRPGRIDRKIKIPNPNNEGRLAILKIHLKKIKIESGIDLWLISKNLKNSSGAEIKSVCMESGISAVKNKRTIVIFEDFYNAIEKIFNKNFNNKSEKKILFSI